MQNFDVVGALAFFTIGAALVFGIISWMRAKKAQDHHEDAAVAQRQRAEEASGTREEPVTDSAGRSWTYERGANPPTPAAKPLTPPD
jgi:hypothetical protein